MDGLFLLFIEVMVVFWVIEREGAGSPIHFFIKTGINCELFLSLFLFLEFEFFD